MIISYIRFFAIIAPPIKAKMMEITRGTEIPRATGITVPTGVKQRRIMTAIETARTTKTTKANDKIRMAGLTRATGTTTATEIAKPTETLKAEGATRMTAIKKSVKDKGGRSNERDWEGGMESNENRRRERNNQVVVKYPTIDKQSEQVAFSTIGRNAERENILYSFNQT